ncbi:flavin reductase family protein [Marinifilum sp. N1E240]|uniref:flavin reductase family protein n=1 Tax=Marinifilum sp. N1E240 TaxID=2608082 RepID=UPI00128B4BE5|nr:flavin reductase family protein [Marinifilum sp. N1E240]MPQ46582.1 flavin reductase family protein [Marinifilum sp. N1E240]
MAKQHWRPGTMVYPIPAVMVSCGSTPEEYNIITIAWTGTICSDPAMCYISVRKNRHSYDIIKNSGEFVINLTTKDLAHATDWCGVKSGKDFDKFAEMNLTPGPSREISAPIIEESPLSIECKVKNIVELGSHDMFIAEVVNVQADEKFINPKTGKFLLSKSRPLAYSHGYYFELGKLVGQFGHSVMKKKTREVKGKKGKVKKEKK